MAGCFSIEPRTEPWSVDCRRKAERIPGEYGELGDMRPLGEVWPLMEALEASAASLRSHVRTSYHEEVIRTNSKN